MIEAYKANGFTKRELTISRYKIAKNVFCNIKSIGKNKYKRIELALNRLAAITIIFDGLFYENDEYTSRTFHFINQTKRSKSGEIVIELNEAYLEQLRQTKFFKSIDFEQFRKFKRAISARLYEILIKSFQTSDKFLIRLNRLAEKLTLEKRAKATDHYPSDVLRRLKPAIKEINSNPNINLSISFHYTPNKSNASEGLCEFRTVAKNKHYIPAKSLSIPKGKKHKQQVDIEACYEYFSGLPEADRNQINTKIEHYYACKVLDTHEEKVYRYMLDHKLWPQACYQP